MPKRRSPEERRQEYEDTKASKSQSTVHSIPLLLANQRLLYPYGPYGYSSLLGEVIGRISC